MKAAANKALMTLGQTYHDGLPIASIDAILATNGFNQTEPAIYCGAEGRIHEQVGDRSYLTMSWYKMPSGRYEVTAYVS